MKIRRLLALLLGITLFPAYVTAEELPVADTSAENVVEQQTDDRFHLFKALGIIKDYKDETDYFDIPYVSRGEYCTMMSLMINDTVPAGTECPFIDIEDNKNKEAIAYLFGMDIASGMNSEEFKPELAITVEHAVIIASRLLGYDFFVENYPGTTYREVAQKYKLLKNISGELTEAMTKTQLLILLENIIDAEPFGVNISDDKALYGIHEDGTVLGLYKDIYKTEGVMTENAYTDEIGIKNSKNATVVVDDVTYWDDAYQDKTDFLGKYVDIYYKEENGDKTALYLVTDEKKTTELFLTPDIIPEPITTEAVVYEDGVKLKKAKLSRALKVVYNGVAYTDYKIEELKPEYGELRLIDNNADEIFDYAFVTSYELMWFDRYSALDKKFYNKFASGMTEVYVDDPQIERNMYIESDGEVTDRFGISAGNILLVAESRNDGEKVIKIIGSSDVLDGTLTSNTVNDYGVRELVIDGEVYLVNPETDKRYASGDAALASLEIGKSYTFYFDATGRVAAFVKGSNAELYGYANRYYMHEDDRFSVKVFTENGEWKRYYFAEKLRVNGEAVKDETAFDILAPGGITSPQMIKFRIVNEELKQVATPIVTDEYKKDAFTTSGLKEFMYVGATKNLGDRYFFNSGAKIFVIPTNRDAGDDDYKIETSGILRTETVRYNMEVYDADEFGHSSIFKLETTSGAVNTNSGSYPYHVIRSVGKEVNEKDEVVGFIECAADGEDEIVYYGKDENIFDGLKTGDIIQIEKNANGFVDGYTEVYKNTQFGTLYDDGQPDMYNVSIDIRGYVLGIDASRYVMKLNINATPVYIKSNSAPNVVMVEGSKVRTGTFNDIRMGDYIVGRVGYGQISDVVIIRN